MPVVRSGGVDIFYEVQGRGPTVLLHTGAGGDHRMWGLAGYLGGLREFRVIAMDHRGRGQSGRPDRVEDHRIDLFASDVAAVLDDAGADSAALWGYSDGALVGVAFGSEFPRRLKALVGTGSLPFLDASDLPHPGDPEPYIRDTVAKGGVVESVERFAALEHDRFPDAIERNVRETDPRMYALNRLAWNAWHGPKSCLRSFPAPVLMLTGEKEDLKHQTESSVSWLPKGRVVRLAGVGHLGAFYRSELALPHALPFLREALR
jgi:pimeloyl-ACP methyl ester carboxylesterase